MMRATLKLIIGLQFARFLFEDLPLTDGWEGSSMAKAKPTFFETQQRAAKAGKAAARPALPGHGLIVECSPEELALAMSAFTAAEPRVVRVSGAVPGGRRGRRGEMEVLRRVSEQWAALFNPLSTVKRASPRPGSRRREKRGR